MNICIVAGARPNFVKVAPIIRAVEKVRVTRPDIHYTLVYAGRNDDPTLEPSLFNDLQIAPPTVFLGVDSASLNEITGRVMGEFEQYLLSHPTDVVIVVDDLASTMAAAIVTKKQGVRLAHLVAGTRSFDIRMPKEINRLVIDGLSDLLFTAGDGASNIVTREGANLSKIYKVGNILMDSLRFNHNRWTKPDCMERLGLRDRQYIVFTLNRKALIADKDNLKAMVRVMVENANGIPIVAPLRGLAAAVVSDINNQLPQPDVIITEPFGYLDFGYLTAHALGIVTDSGNVAEEATFNSVPCITLNSYTEHIETVTVGSNVLVGEDPGLLAENMGKMARGEWKTCGIPDRWDGRAAERIVQILIG
ncbi:MAG: UDP-N-acetyl glucosamine 2-epimerase [Prevotella sp.]|nr:UDP-N-acetyl glucosamine 2-epimerase [Prevotella sp.]